MEIGLSYKNKHFLIGRDRPAKMMYLGGLGAMGVGEMWFGNDHEFYFENWETAPEMTCPREQCKCTAECPPELKPEWAEQSYCSYPRCWDLTGHEGTHHVGTGADTVSWGS